MLRNNADVRRCSHCAACHSFTGISQSLGWSLGKSLGDLRARLGMGTTQTTIFQDGFTSFMGSSVDVDKFFVRFLEKMPKKTWTMFWSDMSGYVRYQRIMKED